MGCSKYAPIVAFAYNRADKIIGCLKSLEQNPEACESDLIVYCDGPKSGAGAEKVKETRAALHKYEKESGFKSVTIIEAQCNKGLADSIIDGVTNTLKEYHRAIVVEDDLIVSNRFLEYMNGALDFYECNKDIGSISAYTYPIKGLNDYDKDVYIMHKGDCWGWATWEDRWDGASWADVDYDAYFANKTLRKRLEQTENGWDLLMVLQSRGKISSWAIRWVLYLLKNNFMTVYPVRSYVTNAGFDGSGTHSNKSEDSHYFTSLADITGAITYENLAPDESLEKQAAAFPRKGLKADIKYRLKRIYVKLIDILNMNHVNYNYRNN